MSEATNVVTVINYIEIIQSVVTIITFLLGGFWTYLLFVKKRQKYPRAELEQRVQHRILLDQRILLFVDIKLINIGEVLITPEFLFCQVEKILPLDQQDGEFFTLKRVPGETELSWQYAKGGERIENEYESSDIEIEPGESDSFHFEFIIMEPIKTVKIYSYIRNAFKKDPGFSKKFKAFNEHRDQPESKDIGWSITILYDLNGGKNGNKTGTAESTASTT
jgi:hypothetical protein